MNIISAPAGGATLSTNAAWTWMKGATTTNQNGTYGTQGVPAAANMPGARENTVSWMDSTGALWLFGGLGYSASGGTGKLNDLWKYDPATTNWTWMKGANTTNQPGTYGTLGVPAVANTPGARNNAVSWTDSTGALWLFGGWGYPASGGTGNLNDLWKYDPATTNWTWMKGTNIVAQNGTYGTQGVPSPANTPGTRNNAVSWKAGSGALWLFGGYGYPASGNQSVLNDLWKYDPATTNWTWMKGTNIISQNGTYGTQGVPATANTPGARYCAVSWTDGSGALWLFGGWGYPASGSWGYLNDLWKYDVGGGISLDTHALVFSATCQGVNPAAQMIGITNVGWSGFTYTNVITYSAGASGWLTVLPADGAVALNGATTLTNHVNISGLGAGTYYATNQVVADATNSPQTVVVTLKVTGPLITANGLAGDVYLDSGDPVTIAVQMMNMEPYLGVEVDWWVIAFAHSGAWYYLNSALQWTPTLFSGDLAAFHPAYQGPLFNLSSTPVLNGFQLLQGTYDFWFAVDYPMDGILNLNGPILYDNVTVIVQ
ncbi:MAG: hypothetical protein KKD76_05180 [Verrucomicrobia bacterium]|nr:hypothetical protein [Verrucomicrobiota bacterium]